MLTGSFPPHRADARDHGDRGRFPDFTSAREIAPMIAQDVSLVVIDGEPLGRRIPVGDAPIVIGRGSGADLRIKDPTVSRHHCVIWYASGRCWVRDLGSTNRTRVNDSTALMAQLCEGDVLVVGHTALTLSVDHSRDRTNSNARQENAHEGRHARRQVCLPACDDADEAGG